MKSQLRKKQRKGYCISIVCDCSSRTSCLYTWGKKLQKDNRYICNVSVCSRCTIYCRVASRKVLDKELEETGYSKTELVEETNDSLKKQVDYIDQYLGDDWKLSYKMTNVEDVTGDDLNDLKSNYEDINVKVSAAKTVEVEFTLKGDETEISNSLEVSVIKVDRSWYLDLYTMGNLF